MNKIMGCDEYLVKVKDGIITNAGSCPFTLTTTLRELERKGLISRKQSKSFHLLKLNYFYLIFIT